MKKITWGLKKVQCVSEPSLRLHINKWKKNVIPVIWRSYGVVRRTKALGSLSHIDLVNRNNDDKT